MKLVPVARVAALGVLLLCSCGAPDGSEDASATAEALNLSPGDYTPKATNYGDAPYIGNWYDEGGYVLGYLMPGEHIYAKTLIGNSVYGYIASDQAGAWAGGHRCGFVQASDLHGTFSPRKEADQCPPFWGRFSMAHGNPDAKPDWAYIPPYMIRDSVHRSNGVVQPALVLSTCDDFTVYANYDPVHHQFLTPTTGEIPGNGRPGRYSVPGQSVVEGSGDPSFGTRFLTSDGDAVQIKDNFRDHNHVPAFGFMHSQCVAGEKVGYPRKAPRPPSQTLSCGGLKLGQIMHVGQVLDSCSGGFTLSVTPEGLVESQGSTAVWTAPLSGTPSGKNFLVMQGDGNLVLYSGAPTKSTAGTATFWLWTPETGGNAGADLSFGDDGSLTIVKGSKVIRTIH